MSVYGQKSAKGKPYLVYMTAGANKFLRIYCGRTIGDTSLGLQDYNFNFHGVPKKPAKAIKLLSLAINEKDTLKWEEYSEDY